MARISRFKKRTSDRSGFDGLEISLVKDGAYKVAGDERDVPPPSKKSLGGEGSVSQGELRSGQDFAVGDITTISAAYDHPINYITAAGGITPSYAHPWMYVAGSNGAINISANPQIVAGSEGNKLTLYCVGSDITLEDGTGLALVGDRPFVMTTGSIISFIYTASGGSALWQETSRSQYGSH